MQNDTDDLNLPVEFLRNAKIAEKISKWFNRIAPALFVNSPDNLKDLEFILSQVILTEEELALGAYGTTHYLMLFNISAQIAGSILIKEYEGIIKGNPSLRVLPSGFVPKIQTIKNKLWEDHMQKHIEPLLDVIFDSCRNSDSSFDGLKFRAKIRYLVSNQDTVFLTDEEKEELTKRRNEHYSSINILNRLKFLDINPITGVARLINYYEDVQNGLDQHIDFSQGLDKNKVLQVLQYQHLLPSHDEYVKKITYFLLMRTHTVSAFIFEKSYKKDETFEDCPDFSSESLHSLAEWESGLSAQGPTADVIYKMICSILTAMQKDPVDWVWVGQMIDWVIKFKGELNLLFQGATLISIAWQKQQTELFLKLLRCNANVITAAGLLLNDPIEKTVKKIVNTVSLLNDSDLNAILFIQLCEASLDFPNIQNCLFPLLHLINVEIEIPSARTGYGFTSPLISAALAADQVLCRELLKKGASIKYPRESGVISVSQIVSRFPFFGNERDRAKIRREVSETMYSRFSVYVPDRSQHVRDNYYSSEKEGQELKRQKI